MTTIEILSKISEHQIAVLMLHEQLADYYDFLGMRGYKRIHEYRYFAESKNMRATHRYAINCTDYLITAGHIPSPRIIDIWSGMTRFQINPSSKSQYVKDGFEKWHTWEHETKELYSKSYEELIVIDDVATACFVKELVENVNMELKYLERMKLSLNNVMHDMKYIMLMQDEVHENYKDKVEKLEISIY